MINYLDTLVSYDDKTITHNDLSILIMETLNKILYHFDIDKDKSKNILYENTFGVTYKLLRNKKVKIEFN